MRSNIFIQMVVPNNTANHVGEMGQVVAARKVSITMVEEWAL